MKTCDCSLCGCSASAPVWGFTLLTRDHWDIAPATNPPGAAERGWLCQECAAHAALAQQAVSRRIRPQSPRGARPLRVLIVDDHVLLLRCMARLLNGCETVVTTSPREALGMLLRGGDFDVIVCDVMMPEVTGPELYARCVQHSPELGRRFLFATSDPIFGRRAIDESAASVGVTHSPPLVRKPVSQAALVAAVSAVAAGSAHSSGTYELRLPPEYVAATDSHAPARKDRPVRGSSSGSR